MSADSIHRALPVEHHDIAGIGGAATAHFLRRLVGDRVVIHVYERERVGGRIKSTPEIEGLTHELGGSMVNHLLLPDLPDLITAARC